MDPSSTTSHPSNIPRPIHNPPAIRNIPGPLEPRGNDNEYVDDYMSADEEYHHFRGDNVKLKPTQDCNKQSSGKLPRRRHEGNGNSNLAGASKNQCRSPVALIPSQSHHGIIHLDKLSDDYRLPPTSDRCENKSSGKSKHACKDKESGVRRRKNSRGKNKPEFSASLRKDRTPASHEDYRSRQDNVKNTKDIKKRDEKRISRRRSREWAHKVNSHFGLPAADQMEIPTNNEDSRGENIILLLEKATLDRNTSTNSRGSALTVSDDYDNIPTVVDTICYDEKKRRLIVNQTLDQVARIEYPSKKKLILEGLNLFAKDVPCDAICAKPLGEYLHKLSLAGNNLFEIPKKLVLELHGLQTLDLQQCALSSLPKEWKLVSLRRLILSHNRLEVFLDELMLEGMPELRYLNMYANRLCEVILPGRGLMPSLEFLDVGFNNICCFPDNLQQLKKLKVFKAGNNLITHIPAEACAMDLKELEVTPNPLVQPPEEDCERGILSMRRYYRGLETESSKKNIVQRTGTEKKLDIENDSSLQYSLPPQAQVRCEKSNTDRIENKKLPSLSVLDVPPMRPLQSETRTLSDIPRFMSEECRIIPNGTSDVDIGAKVIHTRENGTKKSCTHSKSLTNQDVKRVTLVRSKLEQKFKKNLVPPVIESVREGCEIDKSAINDTLKIIFVGKSCTGKTSIVRCLKDGSTAKIPNDEERTIGVDIYPWNPKTIATEPIGKDEDLTVDTRVLTDDKSMSDIDVKFSVWDFAGQNVYHATHELFFSPRALYIVVWDMAARNTRARRRRRPREEETGPFALYNSSDEDEEQDTHGAERALERDIDDKVQFWVDCIQSSVPGAAILLVASFDDKINSEEEAIRRCSVMKKRILQHEKRRKEGLKQRLNQLQGIHRANTEAALRLRDLLRSRPNLLFGNDEHEHVLRVSCTEYSGFTRLRDKIVNIATGRERGRSKDRIFRHVGAQIPRMRLDIRDIAREKRKKFKLVKREQFLAMLKDATLGSEVKNINDVTDGLHFLSNIGELSYFGGGECSGSDMLGNSLSDNSLYLDDEDEEDMHSLSIDDCSDSLYSNYVDESGVKQILPHQTNAPSHEQTDEKLSELSEFIFLNPSWLIAAVACILRHDLKQEIESVQEIGAANDWHDAGFCRFTEANRNFPIISSRDACLLWKSERIIQKAAERATNNHPTTAVFKFLQRLLVQFSVFVPIDLNIDKAYFGGKEYRMGEGHCKKNDDDTVGNTPVPERPKFFFLPSMIGSEKPTEKIWTFKCGVEWNPWTTLCHSWYFPDGVPPGMMERITASVLRVIYSSTQHDRNATRTSPQGESYQVSSSAGNLSVQEILCWRSAFLLKLGVDVIWENGTRKESYIEVFANLVDKPPPDVQDSMCVASTSMCDGTRRLMVSGKGQEGDGGRKIWKGGFELVLKAVERVIREYRGVEFQKQGVCPECLSNFDVGQAGVWNWAEVKDSVKKGFREIRCNGKKEQHMVDIRLVAGFRKEINQKLSFERANSRLSTGTPLENLFGSVVLVGLWDNKQNKLVRAGSGFIVCAERGLIVTASHNLIDMKGTSRNSFGKNYYGCKHGKAVIGVMPPTNNVNDAAGATAVLRYFAKIVEKDVNNMDACVLRITSKLEKDVLVDGCPHGTQPEVPLTRRDLKNENLQELEVSTKCELAELVRVIGYNQGGEGLDRQGRHLERVACFAYGYVCKFIEAHSTSGMPRGIPKKEIVAICPIIKGHSGGPCVNQAGEVIGILSRTDTAENDRCYLVPSSEFEVLVKKVKSPLVRLKR